MTTQSDVPAEEEPDGPEVLRARLAEADDEERARVLLDLVRTEAASVLGHADSEEIEPGSVFFEVGFISLTAVEFRNRISAATGLELPVMLIFDHPTPTELTKHLQELLAREGE